MHLFLLLYKPTRVPVNAFSFLSINLKEQRAGNKKTVTNFRSEKSGRPLVTDLADLKKLNPKLVVKKLKINPVYTTNAPTSQELVVPGTPGCGSKRKVKIGYSSVEEGIRFPLALHIVCKTSELWLKERPGNVLRKGHQMENREILFVES